MINYFEDNIQPKNGYVIIKIKVCLCSDYKGENTINAKGKYFEDLRNLPECDKNIEKIIDRITSSNNLSFNKSFPSSIFKGAFHCYLYNKKLDLDLEKKFFGSHFDITSRKCIEHDKQGELIFYDGLFCENFKSICLYLACKEADEEKITKKLTIYFQSQTKELNSKEVNNNEVNSKLDKRLYMFKNNKKPIFIESFKIYTLIGA